MNAHELARKLLAGPDLPVVAAESGRPFGVDTELCLDHILTEYWIGDGADGWRRSEVVMLSGRGVWTDE